MAKRKIQRNVVVNLTEQEWNDALNCITFTQGNHPKDSPEFLKSVEKLRVKFWGYWERQSKKWRDGEGDARGKD